MAQERGGRREGSGEDSGGVSAPLALAQNQEHQESGHSRWVTHLTCGLQLPTAQTAALCPPSLAVCRRFLEKQPPHTELFLCTRYSAKCLFTSLGNSVNMNNYYLHFPHEETVLRGWNSTQVTQLASYRAGSLMQGGPQGLHLKGASLCSQREAQRLLVRRRCLSKNSAEKWNKFMERAATEPRP